MQKWFMDNMLSKEQRITAAAEAIFAKHGFERATVDEIIALADVGKGTVYKYFGNKEQLFYHLVQKKNQLLVERLLHHQLDIHLQPYITLLFQFSYMPLLL